MHRALFLSDSHLGARGARPELVLRFLEENRAESLFLVGDIVDNWHPLAANWSASHHRVLHHILALAQSGTRVVYIPGNHDAFFRHYAGTSYSGIEVLLETSYQAADGRRYLVTHGDCCDIFARRAPLLARLGAMAETSAHLVDAGQKRLTRHLGLGDWHGITRTIDRTNSLIRARDRFEDRLAALASDRGFDGIICGHFHQAALSQIDGIVYANCGDWVGSNTALVENRNGSLRLVGLGRTPEPEPARYPAGVEGELTLTY